MAYIEAIPTSDSEVLAVDFDPANNVMTLLYVTGPGEEHREQVAFPLEDAPRVMQMLQRAYDAARFQEGGSG